MKFVRAVLDFSDRRRGSLPGAASLPPIAVLSALSRIGEHRQQRTRHTSLFFLLAALSGRFRRVAP